MLVLFLFALPWSAPRHPENQRCRQLAQRPGATKRQWPSLVLPDEAASVLVLTNIASESKHACQQRWSQLFSRPLVTHDASNLRPSPGRFDVVIDCGAPKPAEILAAYFEAVSLGGHYIIDDARNSASADSRFELRQHPVLALYADINNTGTILDRCVWSWLVHGARRMQGNNDDGLQASLVVRRPQVRDLPVATVALGKKATARDDGRGAEPRGMPVSTLLGATFQRRRTDKFRHRYDQSYVLLFEPLYKDSVLSMMELGIGSGHCPSLRAWLDYFNSAQIYGYDKRKYTLDADLLSQSRLTIKTNVRTRQSTRGGRTAADVDTAWVAANVPKDLDVIVDDGCHHAFCQLTALKMFWPQLRKGGLYIIEDLWTYSDGLPHHKNGFIVGAKSPPAFLSTRPQNHPLLNHSLLAKDKAVRAVFEQNTWSWMISGLDPSKKFVPRAEFAKGVRGYSAVVAIRKEC